MKSIRFTQYLKLVVLLAFAGGIYSCDDEGPSSISNPSNIYVNTWILENMKFWYYWNDQVPASANRNDSPDLFFESILSSQDKFSWIQSNYQELVNSLKGVSKEAGYEIALYRETPGSDNVIAQVVYVKYSSPAASAGLMRGDVITHINYQQITVSNYRNLLEALGENHTIQYKPLLVEEKAFGVEKTVSLSAVQFSENPNYLGRVFEIDDHKIGYYVYNFFAPGADNTSKAYDNEMDALFADFKAQGITDLIIDLRFNSGGAESSANNLASLIGTGVNNSVAFVRHEYNEGVKQAILADPQLGEGFLTTKFLSKASNIGSQLNQNRVYILTGTRTASASELIINALKPFMDVFIIGDTTVGKNVGSISLYEENDPKNSWGIQPIVVKMFNSQGQSNYENGFAPNVLHEDRGLYIYPLGDIREALLSQAIGHITGTSSGGRMRQPEAREMIGHSLDLKRRSFKLIVDQDALKKF